MSITGFWKVLKGMNLKNTVYERTQTQMTTYFMIPFRLNIQVGKSMGTESVLLVASASDWWGIRSLGILKGYGVSLGIDENILKLFCDNGCISLYIY